MSKNDVIQIEDDASSPDVMRQFYNRLYPFKSIFHWLNHEHAASKLFTHREFAFTLPGDIYLRYNSFVSAEDLKKQVIKLNPSRFEVGAVYTAMASHPRDKKTLRPGALQPVLRELVFDIDMTDYDAIRTCCAGKGICRRCWGFIAAAADVLDGALRDQFGFRHLLWVYSGRRGIHLWISDAEAMALTDEQRKAVMGWLEVIRGGKEQAKKVNVRLGKTGTGGLHPALSAALEHLKDPFGEIILSDQDCFASEEGWQNLLELVPDKTITSNLREQWAADLDRSSSDKWSDFKREIKRETKANSAKKALLIAAMEDIILQYTYPRLDAEVSKHRNHLLKAPFCIHPGTGRVCVPVDPKRVHEFDPECVPTVGQLLRELNDAAPEGQQHHSDWEKTSMKPYVDMLDRHVLDLMDEKRQAKKEQANGKMDLAW